MAKINFSVSDIIQNSWYKFRSEPFFWIILAIISFSLGFISDFGLNVDAENFETNFNPFGFFGSLFSMYLGASITLISINYMRGKSISFRDLIQVDFNKFIHYLLTTLFCGLLIMMGLVFFILPGIYLIVRLMFAQYLVLDKNIAFFDAIKLSWNMTQDNGLDLFSFLLAMLFLLIVGFFSFILGLLLAIPIIWLSTAKIYIVFNK
tara:strand:- start:3231 stop:3848 length:618 start_codon:yes stop_codon:yes gene_type:complete